MRVCGTRYYGNITKQKVDEVINELRKNGVTISGNNPWEADTNQSGVRLRGEYIETTMTLAITVTDCDWYVPSGVVWERIDSLIRDFQRASNDAVAALP